jgi:NADH-quinone oxidoreductase subunit A
MDKITYNLLSQQFFEFYILIIIGIIAFILVNLLVILDIFISSRTIYFEKVSTYECGFQPFQPMRTQFNILFYRVALLFLIFDLELILLLPYITYFYEGGYFSFIVVGFFIVSLLVSYVYEINKLTLVF